MKTVYIIVLVLLLIIVMRRASLAAAGAGRTTADQLARRPTDAVAAGTTTATIVAPTTRSFNPLVKTGNQKIFKFSFGVLLHLFWSHIVFFLFSSIIQSWTSGWEHLLLCLSAGSFSWLVFGNLGLAVDQCMSNSSFDMNLVLFCTSLICVRSC